jgi:hypothetical protein
MTGDSQRVAYAQSACILCGEPVTCNQRDGVSRPAHYSCLGMCGSCFSRPAATPAGVCLQCARTEPDWLGELVDDDEAIRS